MELQNRLKEIDVRELGQGYEEAIRGFLPVKIRDLFPQTALPCDFFFPATNGSGLSLKLERIFSSGQTYRTEFHSTFEQEGIQEIFILREDEDAYLIYFNELIQGAIKSPDIPTEKKTQLLYDNAQRVVEKVFRERPNASNLELGKRFVDTFAVHLSSEEITIRALFNLFSTDYYTFTHSVQVALLGMHFCKFLGWTDEEITDFGIGALFHDIGKNEVPEHILTKPSSLDRDELEIVKKHPLLGFEQLREAQSISDTQLAVVLHHHEAMNGSGYPDGLHGTLIPRYARLAHIIDVFDALTTRRVYKDAVSRDEAIGVMSGEMRYSFDTELLEAFCRFLGFDNGKKPAGPKKKIQIDFNNQVVIQLDEGKRLKSALVGLEHGEYLILRVSGLNYMQDLFKEKQSVIARYTHNGTAYGFRSMVIGSAAHPLRLLFLAYPETVEEISLRKEPRVDCFLLSRIAVRNNAYAGVLMDVSENGCKFALRSAARETLPQVLVDERVHTWIQLLGEQGGDEFDGIIRRVEDDGERIELGIQFIEPSHRAKNNLRKFIHRILKLVG